MEVFLYPSLCPSFLTIFDYKLHVRPLNDVWKIDELLNTIRTEIDARVSSKGAKSSGVENRKPPISSRNNARPSASALLSSKNSEFKIRCAFCGDLHYSASCDRGIYCERRKKILRTTTDVLIAYGTDGKVTRPVIVRARKVVDIVIRVAISPYAIKFTQRYTCL